MHGLNNHPQSLDVFNICRSVSTSCAAVHWLAPPRSSPTTNGAARLAKVVLREVGPDRSLKIFQFPAERMARPCQPAANNSVNSAFLIRCGPCSDAS
jgi:hypothetical protein